VAPGVSDAELGDRLAARTLELIDIPSESRDEARAAAFVAGVLAEGEVAVDDLGDTCLMVRRGAPVLLAGHLDTVPAQDNRPGRRDGERVVGLGASDMKGAVAVMLELARAGAPFDLLLFGREELPLVDSALTPLLARERLEHELVVMMEPTGNELHAGCLGNVNATWTFRGRSAHSARPWDGDNAIHRAAGAIAALAEREPEEHELDGLSFFEVASVTRIGGGIAGNVVPDRVECHVNYRCAPDRTPAAAEARLRELCPGELRVDSMAPSAPVALDNPRTRALIEAGGLRVAPKQAWTPVAEFAAADLDAVNFGPGAPEQAHRRDESVEIAALVRSYRVLEAFAG
jgi:succinyl-diaminopimelate desuccinylase